MLINWPTYVGPKSSGSGTKDSCPGASKKGRRKKRATPIKKSTSSSISTGNCLNFNESLIELPSQLGTPAVEYFVDRNEYPVHEFHTDSLHQSEINDQTLSVGKHIFEYPSEFIIKTIDFAYFQWRTWWICTWGLKRRKPVSKSGFKIPAKSQPSS